MYVTDRIYGFLSLCKKDLYKKRWKCEVGHIVSRLDCSLKSCQSILILKKKQPTSSILRELLSYGYFVKMILSSGHIEDKIQTAYYY